LKQNEEIVYCYRIIKDLLIPYFQKQLKQEHLVETYIVLKYYFTALFTQLIVTLSPSPYILGVGLVVI